MSNEQEFQSRWKDLCDESFLAQVLESMYDAVVVADTEGRIVYVNPAYTREVNLKFENVVGKNIYDIAPESIILKVLESNRPEIEVQSTIQGLGIDIIVSSTPIYKEGSLAGAVSVFKNVTAIKKLSEELEKMTGYKDYLQEQLYLRKKLPEEFDGIIGNNSKFKGMLMKAINAAHSDITVLIRGETGTGKDLMANAIHELSKRKNNPFIEINCAAIPENLLESELFGYDYGAFTGAKRGGKPGKFELADTGTLFLNEIGDMSLHLQSKLLKVLQEKEIERIGGTKSVGVDVRIIAATNQSLEKEIQNNNFRKDLFYRLNVFSIDAIPLRERKDDIPVLSYHFLERFVEREKKACKLSRSVLNSFMDYDWPGNVRELMNIMESAIVSCNTKVIGMKHLPGYFTAIASTKTPYSTDACESLRLDYNLMKTEKECIIKALKESTYNKSKAIKALKISRSNFYEKLRKYNIESIINEEKTGSVNSIV